VSAAGKVFGGDEQRFRLTYDEDLQQYSIRDDSISVIHALGSQSSSAAARTAMDSWLSTYRGGWVRVTYWLHGGDPDFGPNGWGAVYVQARDGVLEAP
jgi:hypothetical protein